MVGGGPICVEFAGELFDMTQEDLIKLYPDLTPYVKIHMIEAGNHLLNTFNPELRDYAKKLLEKRDFDVRTGVPVKEVTENAVHLSDGSEIPCGLVVWSTGIQPTQLTKDLGADHQNFIMWNGRLLMNNML